VLHEAVYISDLINFLSYGRYYDSHVINKIQLFMIIITIKFFLSARYEYIYFIYPTNAYNIVDWNLKRRKR